MTKISTALAAVVAAGGLLGTASAAPIINFQTTGNPGEVVEEYVVADTAAGAYQYGSPERWSFNNGTGLADLAAESGVAKFFLVETTDADLALFAVFDMDDDGSGGTLDTTAQFAQGQGALIVRDDNDGNDNYPQVGPTSFRFDHQWNNCCTDGYVMRIDPDAGQFDLTVDMANVSGITSMVFMDADGTQSAITGNTFRLFTSAGDITGEVPLPGAALLFAPIAGFAAARRRRKA
jgi:hypothetical protein